MPPPSQQQQGSDTSLGPFWIIIGLFVLAWGVWYFAHEQIASLILQLRFWEGKFIHLFTPQVSDQLAVIKNASPGSISFEKLTDISTAIGDYLKYPVAALLGLLAVIIYLSSPTMRFKKTYDMQILINQEKDNWPQINPVAGIDLVKADIDQGPWAMALPPMKFAKKYQLLQLERVIPVDSYNITPKTIMHLKRDDAYRVFALQVGRYWRGVDYLNIHTKALFAVCAARANRDRDGGINLLLHIAQSAASGKLDFTGTDALLAKHKNNKAVVKLTQSHAFVLTVMASLLKLARTDGVLAVADFLWLKPIDRPLWYMLNSVGRQTPHPEVGGPFAHWLAELKFGRKLIIPMVEEAVNALEIALKDVVYIPDEEKEGEG